MSGIFDYNGSALMAMTGESCVAIATDHRLGLNQFTTVANTFPKVYRVTEKSFVGLAGLATDIQTVRDTLKFRMNLYKLREEREMQPKIISNLLSTMLYGRRFAPWFCSPVVAGLDEDNNSFISTFDFIGAPDEAEDFVVAGAATSQFYGSCESSWRPNLNPDELYNIISEAFLAGIDRSCVVGWGASVYLLTPEKLIVRNLKTRFD